MLEAEAFNGPSLIIAYSHCIAHGYDLVHGMEQQKAAVLSGYWPLFRYNPTLAANGGNPLQLDSRPPSIPLEKYIYNETRYTMLAHSAPDTARRLLSLAQENVKTRWRQYEHMASMPAKNGETVSTTPSPATPQATAAPTASGQATTPPPPATATTSTAAATPEKPRTETAPALSNAN